MRCIRILLTCLVAGSGTACAGEVQGEVQWPTTWTVFAPFDRGDPVPEDAAFRSVPEMLQTSETPVVPARQAAARTLQVEPGLPVDLGDFFEEQRAGNVAFVFLELESSKPQTVTLGMGADWWLQVWMNGAPVFDTLDHGNRSEPPTILDHTMDVALREGRNVLAVRFITGRASATLALGGPNEFAAARQREAERLAALAVNGFPVGEQSLVMARQGMTLPGTDADLARGALAGLRAMPARQMRFDRERASARRADLYDTVAPRYDRPVTIRLSKYRYPWEDRHLDAIVWTTPSEEDRPPRGRLEIILRDAGGAALVRHEIDELSPSGLFFSVGFPATLQGAAGSLEAVWRLDDEVIGRDVAPFHVNPAAQVARAGRVPIRILNEPGVTLAHAPMTVGVPFPRGALDDAAHVRLVDESGTEISLQARETARWSRYGSVKWLLCDFTADLEGAPRVLYLEYGPQVRRAARTDIVTGNLAAGFPALDAGRVRINDQGLGFDVQGDGNFQTVLAPEALQGAFVRHEDGRVYTMPAGAQWAFEDLGAEKAVVRGTGWYAEPESGAQFCQFVTRLVFHRASPVVRIFHTWIFTGDGNRDRIADMGWRFETAAPVAQAGLLTAFDGGEWLDGASLVQFDYAHYLLPGQGDEIAGRTPGVLGGIIGDTRLTFGVRDFWQNFPSELEVGTNGFTFYNWPRHNPPQRLARPVAREDAFRSRFVHEGAMLDFRLPDEYATGEIWSESSSLEGHIAEGRPESVNAQGIARTEEMFLYFADASVPAAEAAKVIRGLNDETLRAVADPAWVCASGVFGPVHHRDVENFPEEERIHELAVTAPERWVERLGFYGMWVHGDYPTWNIDLDARTVSTYRTLRKNHHAYPYRWIPFARSGNPRMLKLAQNAVRQMTDANFCHYATADVDAAVGPDHFRRQGWWDRSLLPWAGRRGPHLRSYTVDTDYLWHAYYMTGYGRARDIALLFGELTQRDHTTVTVGMPGRTRPIESMLTSYLDMYQATYDPWFLAALHEIADLKAHLYGGEDLVDQWTPHPDYTGHTWRGASQRLYRFTGGELHRHMALNNAMAWSSPYAGATRSGGHVGGWGGARGDLAAFAWLLTGDDFYLQRVAASLDAFKLRVYEGETVYLRGTTGAIGHGGVAGGWSGPGVEQYVIAQAGRLPEPLHNIFLFSSPLISRADGVYRFSLPEIYVRKDGAGALPLMLDAHGRGRDGVWPETTYGPFGIEVLDHAGAEVFAGEWRAPDRVEIPAGAPAGIYRVNLFGHIPYPDESALLANWGPGELGAARARFERQHTQVFLPLGTFDTPEVLFFAPGANGISVPAPGQGLYFMVPEDVEAFWIEFQRSGRGRASSNRVSVWDPDDQRVYDQSYTGDPPARLTIDVSTGQAGRLWRATGGEFLLDPRIPPYFSVARGKWFDPGTAP